MTTPLPVIPPNISPELLAPIKAQVNQARLEFRATLARELFTPEGFGHFFWCTFGYELAPYAQKIWVPEIFAAHKDNTGVLLEAFRGGGKSIVGSGLDAFIIGHNPKGSILVVAANDTAANKITAMLADIIEYLPGWKTVFPNIVPDKERGWGAQGYQVKDTSIAYDKWVEMTVQDHGRDPSFVGFGVESSSIPGMHPTNVLHVDDIHDDKNTSSPRELEAVLRAVRKNILPTMSRPGKKPFMQFQYTPWVDGDAYQEMESTGYFRHIKTPLYTEVSEGDAGAVDYDGKWVRFADWPEFINPAFADTWKTILKDKVTFTLMMLLDREGAIKKRVFKYYPYRNELINMNWPMVTGADYASVIMPSRGVSGDLSHFSLAQVLKTPEAVAVIAGGIVEQCTQLEAEEYALNAQRLYRGYLNMVVEMDGKGAEFYQLIARHPQMKVIPKWTGGKKKPDRLYKTMSGWFDVGKVRVSDADTKFLRLFRSFLEKFPNLDRHAPEWDVADSVYYALLGMPDVLQMPVMENELPQIGHKVAAGNPWASAGRVL